jgi:tetratricopeptide (TPR) repeat protein
MKDFLKEALNIIKEEQYKNINFHISEFIKKYPCSAKDKRKLNLTDKQKTSILIVSLPPEVSVQVIRELSQEDIQKISEEIALLPNIKSDVRNAVIEEFLDNASDLEKNKWACLINNRVLSDYTAGDYRISFNPEKKIFEVTTSEKWAFKLVFLEGNKFLVHIISPGNKLAYCKNKIEKEYIIKFTSGFYSAVIAVFKENLFFMIFDIRKFNIEKDLLLIYSLNDFRLYINREIPSKIEDSHKKVSREENLIEENSMEYENLYEDFFSEDEDYGNHTEDNYDDSKDIILWLDRGKSLCKKGDYEKAIKCYDKALEIDPADTFALATKGAIFCDQGKFEEALKYCDKALNIDPDDDHVLFCKMSVLTNINRYDEAIFYCNRLLAMKPDNLEVQIVKAKCLFIKGRYEETIVLCNEALESKQGEIRFSLIKSISKDQKGKKHTEEENIKYMKEVDRKYMEEENIKCMEEVERKRQKKEEEEINHICRKWGVSYGKGKKIHYICRECSLSYEEARIFLEENENDERKTVRNIRKQHGMEDRIIYVCRRTKVSEEEAVKALDKYDYDEIEAVMSIKKERRKKRGIVEDNQENKRIECNKKLERIISILKNNLKYVSLFLFSIKSKFVREKNIEI